MKLSFLSYRNILHATKDDVKLLTSHGSHLRILLAYLENKVAYNTMSLEANLLMIEYLLVMVRNLEVKLVNFVVMIANFEGVFDDRQSYCTH